MFARDLLLISSGRGRLFTLLIGKYTTSEPSVRTSTFRDFLEALLLSMGTRIFNQAALANTQPHTVRIETRGTSPSGIMSLLASH